VTQAGEAHERGGGISTGQGAGQVDKASGFLPVRVVSSEPTPGSTAVTPLTAHGHHDQKNQLSLGVATYG
jgi:hypothetical protein